MFQATRDRSITCAALMAAILASTLTAAAAAQETVSLATPPAHGSDPIAVAPPTDFGTTGFEVVTLTSHDFHEFRQTGAVTGVNADPNGFIWATGGSNKIFIASFPVPAGVVIDSFGLRYCDAAANSDFHGRLYDAQGGGQVTEVAGAEFPDTSCALMYDPVAANYAWNTNSGHSLDLYIFQEGDDVTGLVKFRGAELRFKRVVSPAPAVATFLDVPTSDFGFQYIEALAASGITGGCGGGNFCPDAGVTRRQMAIFLAKALGLYFPN